MYWPDWRRKGFIVAPLRVVEICAGAGGQALGLHLAGFQHALAIELDSDAAHTLRHNFARLAQESGHSVPEVIVGDVADDSVWRPDSYTGISLLAGGVPCPPFSIAGKQLGASDERDLFAWAVEAAGRMQPDAVMLENVRGLSMPRFAGYRQAVIDRFEELGYAAQWQLLEARDFGVAQLRPRFVLVALKPDYAPYFRWPDKKPTEETVGSTLVDLMSAKGWSGAQAWADKANRIAPTIVGGSKKHGGPDLGPTRARKAWLELGVNGGSIAESAPSSQELVSHIPRLTTHMVARLQGWHGPEYEWEFIGRKTSVYRQIGNAFPPPVARAVGDSIAAALRQEGDRDAAVYENLRFHDEVYRILSEQKNYIGVQRIATLLRGQLTPSEITKKIANLARDFDVHTKDHQGDMVYRLGEWKAFRGQREHDRHVTFADPRLRSQVS